MAEPDCICEWPDSCDGTGWLECEGCGGDLCVCPCGGEKPCFVCDDCEDDDGDESEDEIACAVCACIIGDEVGYGDTWDGRWVCEGCAGGCYADDED